jgi:hypothetical protein
MIPNDENRQFCAGQIKRLSGTQFFEQLGSTALQELAEALLSAADCQEQAREIITGWHRQGNPRYPAPGDIYAAAKAFQVPGAAEPPPQPCKVCCDMPGFIVAERVITRGVFAGDLERYADFCPCPLGKLKRAAAAELKREKQAQARPDFVSPTFEHLENL